MNAAMPDADPRTTLAEAPMSAYQMGAVLITVALCALDGFDVVSITLAAPGIVKEWGIGKSALGITFSLGLLGMALGSLVLAPLADRVGRRAVVLGSLVAMLVGMAGCASAEGINALGAWRVVTGLGIGAMIAVINPLAAEYANARRRDLAVALMAVGFPIGGVLGGWAAALLLAHHDWRVVFLMGAVAGAAFLPLVLWRLPEPIGYLIEKPAGTSLAKVNAFLRRCGHAPVQALPPPRGTADGAQWLEIFRPGTLPITLQITAIYFLYVMTAFFFGSWIPPMVADLGFPPAAAAGVAASANMAGIAGGSLLGVLAVRIPLKRLVVGAMVGMGLATMAFGFASADLGVLRASAAVAGFFQIAAMVGLYAVISRTFPTHIRATGTGFVIGIGRVGSAISPAAAGFLFAAGMDRGGVSIIMGAAAIAAAGLLMAFPVRVDTANANPLPKAA